MIPVQSVKFRLTLWYAFVLTVFLSLFAFLMHAELSRALYRDVDNNLAYESRGLEESLLPALKEPAKELRRDPIKLAKAIKTWEKQNRRVSRNTRMVRLVGFDHTVYLSNQTGWQRDILFPNFERDSMFMEKGDSFQTIHFQKRPIRLYYAMIRYQNEPLLVLQCGTSIQEVRSTLHRLALIILILIPGAVAAAGLIGWSLVKRSFQPVDSIIREARQITAAYLSKRLPRTKAGDELDRLAETLNEMMDRIETSTRAMQDFSSDISHELKTPLAIIRGEIDLAFRRSRSTEALTETLRVIEGEVNELIRLVDDLILLVRNDAKQLKFDMKRISLNTVLDQLAGRFRERAAEKKIHFEFYAPPEEVEIEGDTVYLKRLFSNLLDNAIKFTPALGKIRMDLKAEAGRAWVRIQDTGIGIEKEFQAKVFARFYRTDQARSQEGAGLGLNIARSITEQHQGLISLDSEPGKGTLVAVSFPLLPPI